MINILHLTPWNLGGATSYVVNLSKVLTSAKVAHRVVRLAKRTEKTKRQIGSYGVYYQNVSFEAALKGKGKWLLASAPTDKDMAAQAVELVDRSEGAYVFHDPNEFGMYPHWETANRSKVICIREAGLRSMPEGRFIPHPYLRVFDNDLDVRTRHAVSVARISAVKNSLWILEANEVLPDRKRVDLVGSLNRFWWNFTVQPKHPEWKMPEGKGFPREAGAGAQACLDYQFMVDLTIFKDDGGGTQYSFLEAMDAGAVPIMTQEWCSYKGCASKLGFRVKDQAALIAFLKNSDDFKKQAQEYREHNYHFIDTVHKPSRIAGMYSDFLGV